MRRLISLFVCSYMQKIDSMSVHLCPDGLLYPNSFIEEEGKIIDFSFDSQQLALANHFVLFEIFFHPN